MSFSLGLSNDKQIYLNAEQYSKYGKQGVKTAFFLRKYL